MPDKLRSFLRILLRVLAGLLAIIVLILVATFVFYPTEYVMRVLRWGDADVYDYQKFPERSIVASDETFSFDIGYDEARIAALFEADARIDDLDSFLVETQTQAFIVIQNDKILYEKYFNGAQRDSIVTSFSMAKSYTSALIGIAIAEGDINSIADPITDYLPELLERDPGFAAISIADLLRMSSGINYREFMYVNGDDAKTYYYPDLRTLALEQTRITGEPGEVFVYNNYHPLLLGLILERATGQPVATYLEAKIWQRIGTEYDASWSLDNRDFEKMESGINARTIDFAKLGRLFLNDGLWEGEQVIPAEWVHASTSPYLPDNYNAYYPNSYVFQSEQGYYGYMWWGMLRGADDYDFAAEGNHGQTIYISPHKNLIVVRNAERYGAPALDWWEIMYDFATRIESPE